MKKILILTALVIACAVKAQDTLKIEVDGKEIIIITDNMDDLSQLDLNKLMGHLNDETQALTDEYNKRVSELTRQYNSGEITEEEYYNNMEMEAERFEIKMEALDKSIEVWGEAYEEQLESKENSQGEQWEHWAYEWERRAEDMEGVTPPPPPPPGFPRDEELFIEPDTDFDLDWERYKKNRAKRRTNGQGDIHFGWNTYLEDGYLVTDDPGELRPWQSTFFALGAAGKTRIGGENSIFYIRYGGQFYWHHFRLKGNNIIHKDATIDGVVFTPVQEVRPEIENVSFSGFNVAYLDVPIMFMLDFSKRGMDNSFTLGLGGYGGVRIAHKRNIIYDDFNNDPVKERVRNNFYMNQWRYGAQAQIGYGAFKLTAKYDLNQLFRIDRETPDYQILSISFGFAF